MPTYLYLCPQHGEFEEMHSISIILKICSKCQEENINPPNEIKRLINCSSKGTVELYGNDLVEKLKSDAQKTSQEASKDEKLYSNILGETMYQNLQQRIDSNKKR